MRGVLKKPASVFLSSGVSDNSVRSAPVSVGHRFQKLGECLKLKTVLNHRHIYTHKYTHIQTRHTSTYRYTYNHIFKHIYRHTWIGIRTYTHTHKYTHAHKEQIHIHVNK